MFLRVGMATRKSAIPNLLKSKSRRGGVFTFCRVPLGTYHIVLCRWWAQIVKKRDLYTNSSWSFKWLQIRFYSNCHELLSYWAFLASAIQVITRWSPPHNLIAPLNLNILKMSDHQVSVYFGPQIWGDKISQISRLRRPLNPKPQNPLIKFGGERSDPPKFGGEKYPQILPNGGK